MRILWDFRLFSFGYANRGVGMFTRHMAEAILSENITDTISIWAERDAVPEYMKSWPVSWIPYKKKSWKHDLMTVPYVIINNGIDLFHYWINLGPIHEIGMGMFHPCPAIATVYDLGVELWDDIPFAASKKNTRFWKTQKYLIQQSSLVLCISKATQNDLRRVINKENLQSDIVYVPLPNKSRKPVKKREPYFVTLGGSVHKNLHNVISAFHTIHKNNSSFTLKVLGDVDIKEEGLEEIPEYVQFEDMSRYQRHLQHASGLIFCSFHEGLGLPPIEGMNCNCPLLLSDIPSLRETCNEYACFVDPNNVNEIADGIHEIIHNQEHWIIKSGEGKKYYRSISKDSGKKIVEIYDRFRK
jgi:glycosyltransferase involved in cell wall biosynthesis